MRVVLCAIAKNEHLYINEWVKHYLSLGVDHICIYDNDDKESPYIGCYIDKRYAHKVTIYNVRGIKKRFFQHQCYTSFYRRFGYHFDWVLYCDIDEFLSGVENINKFLSNPIYKRFNQIRVKWKLYGDDGLVTRDTRKPIFNFFKVVRNNLPISHQTKFFIRGGLNLKIDSVHFVRNVTACYPSGKIGNNTTKEINPLDYKKETVFMHHYMTKTLSEFIDQKLKRGDVVFHTRNINFDYYWRINDKTKEKIDYIKNKGL